jgi:adenosylcobinamide-GDP ribazoletransferase
MKVFLSAIQFLTIIPINVKLKDKHLASSLAYFPMVGVLLGLGLWGVNIFLARLGFNDFLNSSILVVFLIIMTGGLHLDGLADTCDGLYGQRSKEKRLEIMRDPCVGAMGVLGLICAVILKIVLVFSLPFELRGLGLVLMCMISRFSMVLSLFVFPYARQEGKAKSFINSINLKIFIMAALATLLCTIIIFKLPGFFILAAAIIFVVLLNKFISKELGGITGDTIGAAAELVEVFVLFCLVPGLTLKGG